MHGKPFSAQSKGIKDSPFTKAFLSNANCREGIILGISNDLAQKFKEKSK